MKAKEALEQILKEESKLVYVSGKTCTGKSTFASRLQGIGYGLIELDKIVRRAVIEKWGLDDEGEVFSEVFKRREKMEWVEAFVREAREEIEKKMSEQGRVVVEGAVANETTLREVLSGWGKVQFYYFHPIDLKLYASFIKARFKESDKNYRGNLPDKFWSRVEDGDFKVFCEKGELVDGLKKAIEDYVEYSRGSSEKRLDRLKDSFKDIQVVEI